DDRNVPRAHHGRDGDEHRIGRGVWPVVAALSRSVHPRVRCRDGNRVQPPHRYRHRRPDDRRALGWCVVVLAAPDRDRYPGAGDDRIPAPAIGPWRRRGLVPTDASGDGAAFWYLADLLRERL